MTKLEKNALIIPSLPTVLLGNIKALNDQGYPLVVWDKQSKECLAYTQQAITQGDVGKNCTLAFIDGDATQPVVMGVLHDPETKAEAPVIIESDEAIILQSGKAKIELHSNGRLHLQGLHISSQAYGPNQLKGASVKIN